MSDTFPNLNLLLTLKVLLEERHVTLAARRLCLTQSAVSKRLSLLRDIFHDPLLVQRGQCSGADSSGPFAAAAAEPAF